MIRLLYAHHPELLAQGLAENLFRELEGDRSLLQPVEIIVPNRNLKTWLTYDLTRRLGAIGHLRFRFLSEFLASAAAPASTEGPVMTQDLLVVRLLDLTAREEIFEHPALQPVSRYLNPPRADQRQRELRRLQFVETLSGLFLEYEFSRPRMCEAWEKGRLTTQLPAHQRLETWQAELWRRITLPSDGPGGAVEAPLLPLSRRFRRFSPDRTQSSSSAHLFAFSYMARGYIECLHQLGLHRPIHLYILNPCREFWEDIETPAEQRRRRRFSVPREGAGILDEPADNPFNIGEDMENPLLQMWGKPGRENIRFLNEAVDCDFETIYPEDQTSSTSLLARLQEDIFRRTAPLHPDVQNPAPLADSSLRVLTAPTIRRETEVIADEIWQLTKKEADSDRPLHFSDIAIIVPPGQKERYFAHFRTVFHEANNIPHNLPHTPEHRRPLEAAALLFALPFGDWRRTDLLRLFQHHALKARFPQLDPELAQNWCEELSVYRCLSHADQKDTYNATHLYNWNQARSRLALGIFMDPGTSDSPHVFNSGPSRSFSEGKGEPGLPLLPASVPTQDWPAAAAFLGLMDALERFQTEFQHGPRSLQDWSATFLHWFRHFLGPYPDEPTGEQRLRAQAEQVIIALGETSGSNQPVSPFIATQLFLARLEPLEGESPRYLSRGVSISSFLPMRPIPFRVIFMAGMGEGRFPASDRRHALDLRACHRLPGDVSPREQDRYLFLETLLSAREKLYLSYQDRDEITLDRLQPSIVIQELLSVLRTRYLKPEEMKRLITIHPLRRDSAVYWDHQPDSLLQGFSTSSEAAGEAFCRQMHDYLAGAFPGATPTERLNQAFPTLPVMTQQALKTCGGPLIAISSPPPPPGPPSLAPAFRGSGRSPRKDVRLSLNRLKDFLVCPLQGSARFLLNLGDEADDREFHQGREPLTTEFLPFLLLCQEVFFQAVSRSPVFPQADVPALWDSCARFADLRGVVPAGFYGEPVRENGIVRVTQWLSRLSELDLAGCQVSRYASGGMTGSDSTCVTVPPLELTIPSKEAGEAKVVYLNGRTGPVLFAEGRILLPYLNSAGKAKPDHYLTPYLHHLFLVASGLFENCEAQYAPLSLQNSAPAEVRRHPGLTAPAAREVLQVLIGDLVSGFHEYLYPFSLIETLLVLPPEPVTAEKWQEKVREHYENAESGRFSFSRGPLRSPTDYPVLPLEQAIELCRQRFGPFFAARRGES